MVLLSSVSAFAQSGGNEPLKGDVNEDGTVDVADIVSVIKIMKDSGGAAGEKTYYWYAGTEVVTTDNFTDVASKIPESEIPEAGSVTAAGQYIYFVMPETMRLASLELAGGSAIEYECTDVMGYHIYKTSSQVNGQVNYSIEQVKYYWYVGQSNPAEMTSISPIVTDNTSAGWRLIGTTLPSYSSSNKLYDAMARQSDGSQIITGQSLGKQWVAIPNKSSACVRDGAGNDGSTVNICIRKDNKVLDGVEYKIYEWVGKAKKLGYDIY